MMRRQMIMSIMSCQPYGTAWVSDSDSGDAFCLVQVVVAVGLIIHVA